MKVHTATLAGGTTNADRVFVIDHAVIVLDGAAAFVPVDVEPSTYAETLGLALVDRLSAEPEIRLPDAVAGAIASTVSTLELHGDASPSSTVAILRTQPISTDLYVLGDSPIYYGGHGQASRLTDSRLPAIARYRETQLSGLL